MRGWAELVRLEADRRGVRGRQMRRIRGHRDMNGVIGDDSQEDAVRRENDLPDVAVDRHG